MKLLFVILTFFFTSGITGQIPKNGTYIHSYCDIEYNKCLSKCKVKINGNKIWVYAPPNLSGIKEGELFESGTLSKHQSGKWTIINSQKSKSAKSSDTKDVFVWIDFSKKQFWTF
jgi:hypothetical protein